jgi:chaperonin GroES
MLFNIESVEPQYDFILVKRYKGNIISPGGIELVQEEEGNLAEVVAVGPGREGLPITVKPGDKVLVARYIGVPLMLNGEAHLLIKAYDAQAKVVFKGDR